jgi:hypothetical protein
VYFAIMARQRLDALINDSANEIKLKKVRENNFQGND